MSDMEGASRAEAIVAGVHHHHHHPADPNTGVVRVRLERRAILAAVLAASLTIAALVLLGLAV
jgi:3',5'-cyclic AMP phosphodiesterase CpdA